MYAVLIPPELRKQQASTIFRARRIAIRAAEKALAWNTNKGNVGQCNSRSAIVSRRLVAIIASPALLSPC
jgi:hypothetical protein